MWIPKIGPKMSFFNEKSDENKAYVYTIPVLYCTNQGHRTLSFPVEQRRSFSRGRVVQVVLVELVRVLSLLLVPVVGDQEDGRDPVHEVILSVPSTRVVEAGGRAGGVMVG